MGHARQLGLLAAVLTAESGLSQAQASAPTAVPPAATAPATLASAPPEPSAPVHRAQASYQLGQLTVIAENSSLDEILRDIAHQTGMKITGGVADQQVFGTYGPGPPSQVIGALLDGSGSNFILRLTAAHEPTELVLTPMQGSPTPPDIDRRAATYPSQQPYSAAPYPPAFGAPSGAASVPTARPEYVPPQPQQVILSQPPASSAQDQQAAPAAPTSQPASPNGVLTPEQIYQQLQRLQQQQPQAPAGSR